MSLLGLPNATYTIRNYKDFSTLLIQKGFSTAQRLHALSTLHAMRLSGEISKGDKNVIETYRTKKKIKDLIEMNLQEGARFITLTYQENIIDYKKAYSKFNDFIKIINRKLAEQLKYLVVKEHQKRGAIHYHMILFNNYDYDIIGQWCRLGYGQKQAQNQKDILTFEPLRMANYMTKYLTKKDEDHKQIEKGFRAFSYSRNLKQPTKISLNQLDEKIKMLDLIHEGKGILLIDKVDFHRYKYVLNKRHTKDLTPF